MIQRSINGASSNYYRQVEYDGDVDIDGRETLIEDSDFSYCDIPSADKEYRKMLDDYNKKSIDATTVSDDDASKDSQLSVGAPRVAVPYRLCR